MVVSYVLMDIAYDGWKEFPDLLYVFLMTVHNKIGIDLYNYRLMWIFPLLLIPHIVIRYQLRIH